LDGLGLLAAIRADASIAATPVILLSARAGEEATADGLRAGADDYIVKPFTASALLVRVQAQLARGEAASQERERLHALLVEAPAAVCSLRGPELVIEFANPRALEAWGRSPDIVGKPLLVALPELADQPFPGQLREVLASGRPIVGIEV